MYENHRHAPNITDDSDKTSQRVKHFARSAICTVRIHLYHVTDVIFLFL